MKTPALQRLLLGSIWAALVACTSATSTDSTPPAATVSYGAPGIPPATQEQLKSAARPDSLGESGQSFSVSAALAAQLTSAKPGDAFDWPLPDGQRPDWRVLRVDAQGPSSYSVIASASNDGHAVIGISDVNAVQARLVYAGEEWLFQSSHIGQRVAARVRDQLQTTQAHDPRESTRAEISLSGVNTAPWQDLVTQGRLRAKARAASEREARQNAGSNEQGRAASEVILDVLFVVAPSLQQLYGSLAARDADIALIVGITNQAFITNGVSAKVRVAGTHAFATELGETPMGDVLGSLNTETSGFTGLWPIQRDTGADLVSMLIPFRSIDVAQNRCGIAFTNSLLSGGSFSGNRYATSVVARLKTPGVAANVFCSNESFAHELGHNLGLAHDRISDPNGTAALEYGRGYAVPGKFRDIMGTGSATRLMLYSDPNSTCSGEPCGIAAGNINSADAARALRVTAPLQAVALDPRERFNGWYVVRGEMGTGWAIEIQDTRMFAAYFHYTDTGQATWIAGAGRECGVNKFCVDLNEYRGGATASGAYKAPSSQVRVATATFTLASQGAEPGIDLVLGNRAQRLSRFNIMETADALSLRPQFPSLAKAGWYWDPAAGGTGIFVETQGATSFVGYFHYRADGSPTWLVARGNRWLPQFSATGAYVSASNLSLNFESYRGGQTLSGPWKAPSVVNAAALVGFVIVEADYLSIADSSGLRQTNRFVSFRDF